MAEVVGAIFGLAFGVFVATHISAWGKRVDEAHNTECRRLYSECRKEESKFACKTMMRQYRCEVKGKE